MARRELGPATLAVVQAIEAAHTHGDVLVACSGGSDSMALALGAAIVGRRHGFPVRAVCVDHGLQTGSDRVADGVVTTLVERGIPATVVRVIVHETGQGLEAAARDARYRALTDAAHPGDVTFLGHTLDDQAETVLLGLARGSGTRSLAGMPFARGPFVRPLLGVRSSVTTQACRELGVAWHDDVHNTHGRFSRVRVRRDVMPVLERDLGPGVAEALARTAILARRDADALDALAEQARAQAPGPRDSLDCAWFAELMPALGSRVLRLWTAERGVGHLEYDHTEAVLALVHAWHGQRGVDVPGARIVRRDGRLYCLTSESSTRGPTLDGR